MKTIALGAVAGVALSALALQAATAQENESTVRVLHGVPDLTVDVYANGEALLPAFEPGTLTDALTLPAGEYDLEVFAAGADPETEEPAISAMDVAVPGGADITVVAHLDAEGTPVLTPFVNDVSAIEAGQTRLTVRHTAAAPAVDIRAGGEVVIPGLANPGESVLDLAAGTVSADVALAGTEDIALGPVDLDLPEGTNTIVYAWGSAADGNLNLAMQSIEGLHSAPSGVPTGEAGLADAGGAPWVLLLGVAGIAGVALAGRRLLAGGARI